MAYLIVSLFVIFVSWSWWYRRRIGKPIFVRELGETLFYTHYALGYRRDAWPFRVGFFFWLVVALDDDHLTTFMPFPGNILLLGDLLDLDHVVPVGNVVSVKPRAGSVLRGVDVSFRAGRDETVELTLYFRDWKLFFDLLRKKAGIDFLDSSR